MPVRQTTPQIVPKVIPVSGISRAVSQQNSTAASSKSQYVIINSATNASPQVVRTIPSTAVVTGTRQVLVKQSATTPQPALPTPLSGATVKVVSVVPQQVAAVAPKVVTVPSVLPKPVTVGLPVKGSVTPQIVQVQTQQVGAFFT